MGKVKKQIIFFAVGFLFLFALPAQAANLYFSPSTGSFNKGENFTVGVYIDAETSINAVQSSIIFPTEYFEAIKIESNTNSIIDLWVQKPSFSNAGVFGNAQFEGVILNPGFIGSKGKIISIVFRVRKEGTANLNFSEFSVLANDGFGTNLPVSIGKAGFTFLYAEPSLEKNGTEEKEIKAIEDKIRAIEQRERAKTTVSLEEEPESFIDIWKKLPSWMKISASIFIGVASVVLLFVIISLGIVVLLWIWGYSWRRKENFLRWLKLTSIKIKIFFGRLFKVVSWAGKEFEGDIEYSLGQLKEDFRETEAEESFSNAIKNYLSLLKRIFKRFFTINNKSKKDDIDNNDIFNNGAS